MFTVLLWLGLASPADGPAVILEDDFEGNTVGHEPIGWSKYCYGGAALEVVDDVFHPGVHDPTRGQSVKLCDPGAGAACISRHFPSAPPKTMKVMVTVHMRCEQPGGQAYPIAVQGYAIRVGFDQDGRLFYATAGGNEDEWRHLDAYEPGRWYGLEQ